VPKLTAIEPPRWVPLMAGYARDQGLRIAIIDSEAEELGPMRSPAGDGEAPSETGLHGRLWQISRRGLHR